MNIIINQKKLLNAVHTVERVVSKNISLPILTAVFLQSDNGRLKLSATNLEIGMHFWVGAKIEEGGSIAVPMKVFSDFINSVQDEKLNMRVEKGVLHITSEHYITQILGMKSDDFPIIPKLKDSPIFTLQSGILASALGRVFDATSLLETRPELSGVYISVTPDKTVFAATDSFRLSEYIVGVKNTIEKSFILPRTTAIEVLRLASGRDEPIQLMVGENQVAISGTDVEIISRLIDGHYPDYKKVIPEHYTASVTVDKQVLEQHVRMASVFSSSISDLSLKVAKGALHIAAKNSDRGEIASHIPLENAKTSFAVSVNYRYILDALRVIPASEVTIGYSGDGSPLVIKGVGDQQHTYVIMPLRS